MNSLSARSVIALCGLAGTALAAAASPPRDEAAKVETGRSVYRAHCAACHGASGEGARNWRRPDARGELPAPPHNARGHTWKHSDAMLYRIVREGWRDPFNKTERKTMPAFRDVLSHADTVAVITYLKTLWTPEERRFQAQESRGQPFRAQPP